MHTILKDEKQSEVWFGDEEMYTKGVNCHLCVINKGTSNFEGELGAYRLLQTEKQSVYS